MPRATFKPLSTANLARTMIAILAMNSDDIGEIAERIAGMPALMTSLASALQKNGNEFVDTDNPPLLFDAILQLRKSDRQEFVNHFDKLLNELVQEDFFGTEGQNDPRGSHRD